MTEPKLACLFCGGSLWVTLTQEGHGHMTREVPGGIECDRCGAEWGPDGSFAREPAGSSWWHGEVAP